MKTLKEVLMERDGIDEFAADERINEAREFLWNYVDNGDLLGAEEYFLMEFGLEPDYMLEIII